MQGGHGNTGVNYEMEGTILCKTVKEKDLGVTMNANMKVSEQCRIAASGYSRTPLIRPPSESHWCGRIRGMVAREGFVYEMWSYERDGRW